jgi:hypothetical protein
MGRPRASRRELQVLVVVLCAFALLLWAMAIFLDPNQIVVNGRKVKTDDPAYGHSMTLWRILMAFGGVLSVFLACLCHRIARGLRD